MVSTNSTAAADSRVGLHDRAARSSGQDIADAPAWSLTNPHACSAHRGDDTYAVAADAAIGSDSLVVTVGQFKGNEGRFFTPRGPLYLEADGLLRATPKLKVQGYRVDDRGAPSGPMTDLFVPACELRRPRATRSIRLAGNLDHRGPVQNFHRDNPEDTSVWQTSISVYDSMGAQHKLRTFFSRSGPALFGERTRISFEYSVLAEEGELAIGQPNPVAFGRLGLDTEGRLAIVNEEGHSDATARVSFRSAAPGQALTLNFGDPTSAGGSGVAGLTSYVGGNLPHRVECDGRGLGVLQDISISQSGLISGRYTDGSVQALSQLATLACVEEIARGEPAVPDA